MEQNTLDFDVVFEEGLKPGDERMKIKGGPLKKSVKRLEEVSSSSDADILIPIGEPRVSEEPRIYTVSEITKAVRSLLESNYPDVWVTGEVGNLRNPDQRNYYFVLKDETSQLKCAIFGGRSKIDFDLEDGLEVICHGRISVYSARGEYQIIIDKCEPKGKGALQIAFEQLKKKLDAEGLFAKERKRALPFLPRKIGVVTSPTGAAIRDIIHVLTRRFPTIEILLIPVRVQGDGAAEEIAKAIEEMNGQDDIDVMIVGRGGGSLEDLWAFNEEIVARAIFSSRIPVISAVGHEIDFTIADFVADVRAPTPSAAAEIAVPELSELLEQIAGLKRQLFLAVRQNLQTGWSSVQMLRGRLSDPSRRFPDLHMRLDTLSERLKFIMQTRLALISQNIAKLESNLKHLSPLHILEKGYSVVCLEGQKKSIKSSKSLKDGADLKIRFFEGSAKAKVTKVVNPATKSLAGRREP
jgi:exodeoxyribonuclease VII large subunit